MKRKRVSKEDSMNEPKEDSKENTLPRKNSLYRKLLVSEKMCIRRKGPTSGILSPNVLPSQTKSDLEPSTSTSQVEVFLDETPLFVNILTGGGPGGHGGNRNSAGRKSENLHTTDWKKYKKPSKKEIDKIKKEYQSIKDLFKKVKVPNKSTVGKDINENLEHEENKDESSGEKTDIPFDSLNDAQSAW